MAQFATVKSVRNKFMGRIVFLKFDTFSVIRLFKFNAFCIFLRGLFYKCFGKKENMLTKGNTSVWCFSFALDLNKNGVKAQKAAQVQHLAYIGGGVLPGS